jgi:hypothetical protein
MTGEVEMPGTRTRAMEPFGPFDLQNQSRYFGGWRTPSAASSWHSRSRAGAARGGMAAAGGVGPGGR